MILIKLADRLHNMRTIEYLGKQKQIQKAKETLEVYAPLAHRLGIHAIKWELEDLAFQILHPRKYAEIKAMVAEQRADREAQVEQAAAELKDELREGRDPRRDLRPRQALLLDLRQDGEEGPRVQRDLRPHRDAGDRRARRRGGQGTATAPSASSTALWKPMPGRFKDFIAMPKLNRYQSLHTTVIGPNGQAARDPGAHARDARGGRVRRRRALALQARQRRPRATTSGSRG